MYEPSMIFKNYIAAIAGGSTILFITDALPEFWTAFGAVIVIFSTLNYVIRNISEMEC